jgi:hypothetical protein
MCSGRCANNGRRPGSHAVTGWKQVGVRLHAQARSPATSLPKVGLTAKVAEVAKRRILYRTSSWAPRGGCLCYHFLSYSFLNDSSFAEKSFSGWFFSECFHAPAAAVNLLLRSTEWKLPSEEQPLPFLWPLYSGGIKIVWEPSTRADNVQIWKKEETLNARQN